jgi:hypothetical protein
MTQLRLEAVVRWLDELDALARAMAVRWRASARPRRGVAGLRWTLALAVLVMGLVVGPTAGG